MRMTRFTKLPALALTVAITAAAALAPASPADASPIDDLVDCSDSFWIIACTDGEPEPAVVLGELVAIDSDPVCAEVEDGFIICHS